VAGGWRRLIKSRRRRADQIKEKMDGQVARMVEIKMPKIFCLENLKGRDHWKDLCVDGRIILEWILGKQGGKM
jgi:hypothetical protein